MKEIFLCKPNRKRKIIKELNANKLFRKETRCGDFKIFI